MVCLFTERLPTVNTMPEGSKTFDWIVFVFCSVNSDLLLLVFSSVNSDLLLLVFSSVNSDL